MYLDKRDKRGIAIEHAAPLPRQESSTSTTPISTTRADTSATSLTSTTPTISNKPDDPNFTPSYQAERTKLPGWQIIIIVVGGLLFIGILLTLFLVVRGRIRQKRALAAIGKVGGKKSGSDNGHGLASTGGVFDNMDIPNLPKSKRESVLMEARVKMRKLIKPRRTSDMTGFTSILSLGKGGRKGSGKDLEDDAEESKTMSPWSSNVTRKKSLVIHDSQAGSGLTSLAREQQEREGRHHQQIYPPGNYPNHHHSYQSQNTQLSQYSQPSQYSHSQYSRPYANQNQNNRGSGNNSYNNSNSGRIHNDDNWMLSSDSVAHTIRESFDIVGSYQNDPVPSPSFNDHRNPNDYAHRGAVGGGDDNYLESPPTTGLGHEVIPLESRLGSNRNSGSGFGFGGFKFGHDRRKPG